MIVEIARETIASGPDNRFTAINMLPNMVFLKTNSMLVSNTKQHSRYHTVPSIFSARLTGILMVTQSLAGERARSFSPMP